MAFIAWDRSKSKDMSWLHMPMKEQRERTSCGRGKVLDGGNLVGWTPEELTIRPANSTDWPISSFFLLMVMPWLQQLQRTSQKREYSSSLEGAVTRISWTSLTTPSVGGGSAIPGGGCQV